MIISYTLSRNDIAKSENRNLVKQVDHQPKFLLIKYRCTLQLCKD